MFKKFLEKFIPGNTLYYPGCMTKYVLKDLEKNYKDILRKLNIEFITLKELEFCCGSPVLKAGFPEDFDKLIEKNRETFKAHGISRIITNCPGCYNMLLNNFDIKVDHTTQVIWKNIEKLDLKTFKEKITYHDPCKDCLFDILIVMQGPTHQVYNKYQLPWTQFTWIKLRYIQRERITFK